MLVRGEGENDLLKARISIQEQTLKNTKEKSIHFARNESTFRTPVWGFVTKNTFYRIDTDLNMQDQLKVTKDDRTILLTPINGQPIGKELTVAETQRLLSGFPSSSYFCSLGIMPDSIEASVQLRRNLRELGYKVNYYVNSNNLYYRHTFKDNVYLENTLRFNLNGNQTQGEREENYADWQYHNLYDYDNFRYSGGLETHFVTSLGKHQLELGNELSYLNDKLKQEKAGYPTFRHQNTNEYFYAGLSGNLSKNLSYSLSAGMNYISRKADNIRYNYFRPVESVSLSYRINSGHAITFSHSLTNSAPQVGQLNPYNTSTDSLRVVSGNPYLLPQRIYNWQIRYSFSKQGFSLMPSLAYQLVTDEINNIGYTDPQSHIYTQTYENYGHFSRLTAQVTAGYQNYKWGGINLTIANLTNYFEHQSAKNQFQYMLNFYGYQKRWSWNGNLSYFPKQYGIHSKTISRGAESEFTVTYSLNDQWALNAGMRYFLGMLKSRVYTDEDTYHSQFFMDSKDRRYKVLIGISYSFRKRRAPNRQTKYLNSTESGIDL